MPIFENGPVSIRYEETGSGFPLLILPGGGLESTIAGLNNHAFNPMEEFADSFRCITMDLRNANGGESKGPLDVDRPWEAFCDDQIALMDHLGITRFLVMGFCIGGPFSWNLIRRAPERVTGAVMVHPSGYRSDAPDLFYQTNINGWAPKFCDRQEDVSMEQAGAFLNQMYRENADFVMTVSRDFVRQCQTPVLVLPDDIPAHPYAVAMESALLAPNSQVSLYPWKENPQKVRIAVRHIRMFLEGVKGSG
ncbi:MAG: alpha/beta hydrolase [Burkholderiaceae bacterium]